MIFTSVLYCEVCGIYSKSNVRGNPLPCPKCDGHRVWRLVEKGGSCDPEIKQEFINWDGMNKENVRVSRSLGVPVSKIKEAQKVHPGVEFKDMGNGYACPVIHNRAEKLKVMKQAGYVEFPSNYFQQKSDRGEAR